MPTTIKYRLYRGKHSLRRRGVTLAGEVVDETRQIELAAFRRVDNTITADMIVSKKARVREHVVQIAREIARIEEEKDNDPAAWNTSDDGKEWPFSAVIPAFIKANAIRLAPASLRKNDRQGRHVIRILEQQMRLLPSDVTLAKLETYLHQRIVEEKASPKTAYLEAGFARQLAQWSFDRKDETHCPKVSLTKLPDVANKNGIRQRTRLSEAQLFAVFKAARHLPERGDVLRRVIGFAIGSRLRRSALLNLRGEWCDRHARKLHIPAQPTIVKGRLHHREDILLPLPQIAIDMIADLPAEGPLFVSKYRRAPRAEEAELLIAAAELAGMDVRDVLIVSLTKRHRMSATCVSALRWDQVEGARLVGARQLLGRRGVFVDVDLPVDDVRRLSELAALSGESTGAVFRARHGGQRLGVGGIHDVCAAAEKAAALASREPSSITELDASLAKACAIAQVPRISLQGLRRSGAQLLREHVCEKHQEPPDESVVERLLSHAEPALRVAYGTIAWRQMVAVVERVDCAYAKHCGPQGGVVEIGAAKMKA